MPTRLARVRGVDLVKDAAVSEVLGLGRLPAAEEGVINRDQIDLWEGIDERLVGHEVGLARPVVVAWRRCVWPSAE